jgi:hypothetical protein
MLTAITPPQLEPMSKTADTSNGRSIVADNDVTFPREVYQPTTKATGTQQEVANMWARGDLPTHSTDGKRVKLYSSTGNFRGYQYPSGKGKLMHYSHIQAIRTHSGLVIGDSSCYGRGWAHCTYPNDNDGYIDLTHLNSELKGEKETIYDIMALEDDEVKFHTGRIWSLKTDEWVNDTETPDEKPLGL